MLDKSLIITGLALCLAHSPPSYASGTIRLAVASNFTRPMAQISPAFTKATGIEVQSSFASTGKLFAMIKNGAPFDVFLAADSARPELLHSYGLARKPFIYAQGQPVLWTTSSKLCELQKWQQVVISPQLQQIAIANPQIAPYGLAASKAIFTLPFASQIKAKFVYTQNAGQAFQYAEKITGAGFTAVSFARSAEGQKGCAWSMPEAENVIQKGCVIKQKGRNSATLAFVSFLSEPLTADVIQQFGYNP